MKEQVNLKNLCEELLRILPTGTIQDVMNVSYKYVKVPVLAVDILYNVLGIAGGQNRRLLLGLPLRTQRVRDGDDHKAV